MIFLYVKTHNKTGLKYLGKTEGRRRRGLPPVKQQKVECPHCNSLGGIGNMKRYHFENCKDIIV